MLQATLPPQSGAAPRTTPATPAVRPKARARPGYFGRHHPLAEVARHRCRSRHHRTVVSRLGNVACGACWEHAIRTDERFAVDHGLDEEPDVPADYLDQVALDRALTGTWVRLTPAERTEAVWLLELRRVPPVEIARRLHTTVRAVHQALTLGPARPGAASIDTPHAADIPGRRTRP